MNKRETHVVQGMSRDLATARFNPNLVVDARNIRITTIKENSTLLSVTNEKGTSQFTLSTNVEGTIIGSATINNSLVLFTTQSGYDRIYRIVFQGNFTYGVVGLIYGGNLGFNVENPIETLAVYENENIQKVYWVDGINQPRVVNIANGAVTNGDVFNFNRKIDGGYSMQVTKYNTGGEFPAGTIQYCFNYYNKFGQETNLVDVSPMYYLCPKDKGLPADAISTSSFLIELSNLDSNYEYVRLYSIVRTSENATPNVRIVGDYKILQNHSILNEEQVLNNVSVDLSDLYILNISTGERKLLSSMYTQSAMNSEMISLGDTEYLYDNTSGKIYFLYTINHGGQLEPYKQSVIQVSKYGVWIIESNVSYPYRLYSAEISEGVTNSIKISDNGIIGSTLDASALLFIGGQDIIAGTLASKDNILFLGNIKQSVPNIGSIIVAGTGTITNAARGIANACAFDYAGNEKTLFIPTEDDENVVSTNTRTLFLIDNNKSSYDTKSFKAGENYRLGFVAQYNTGQWSEVVWIGDLDETFAPGRNVFAVDNGSVVWGPSYRKPGFKAELPSTIVNALRSAGFVRVAPVVVYPSFSDRKVLYQGILASTVFNVKDRYDNSPFAQADWRFRMGYNWNLISDEVQVNAGIPAPSVPNAYDSTGVASISKENFVEYYANEFYRDPSILTFHSPDIECVDNVHEYDFQDLKLRIVGISNAGFDNTHSAVLPDSIVDSHIELETQGFDTQDSGVIRIQSTVPYNDSLLASRYQDIPIGEREADSSIGKAGEAFAMQVNYGIYGMNRFFEPDSYVADSVGVAPAIFKWYTYIWHRSGSLGWQKTLSSKAIANGTKRYGVLKTKCISEIKYGFTTFLQSRQENPVGPSSVEVSINTPTLVESDFLGVTRIKDSYLRNYYYYGAIDKVFTATYKDISNVKNIDGTSLDWSYGFYGYPIGFDTYFTPGWDHYGPGEGMPHYAYEIYVGTSNTVNGRFFGSEPVSMKYKTSRHLIFSLKSSSSLSIASLGKYGNYSSYSPNLFWKTQNSTNVIKDTILDDSDFGDYTGLEDGLFVAELYRDFSAERISSRFGGTTQDAIINNTWVRCGYSVQLQSGSPATLYYKEGDTYIGRYDCLKSYPYTNEDQNQIVSIYSTELESRVNLDARYDKTRGLVDNTPVRPTNFNLFNHPGYEQSNQYFTYKALDYSRYQNSYPNLLTWSLEKKMGADVDTWTSISMTSTADAQGDLGEITNLETFNDTLFSFQKRGVAQVLFNERVQIPTSDGVPIEISNGLKFQGLRYLSNQIGLTNKWSLATTPRGMYFIDDEKNILYHFNGQQFEDMSTKFGFNTWVVANNSYTTWNPEDYDNIRTFYDKTREELYFVNKYESLVFSEKLNTFMSFYDYDALPVLVNMNDKLLTFRKNSVNHLNLCWELFGGDFNMFFGTFRPYWLTFVSNSDPTVDKVFNSLAWRSFDYSDVTSDFQGDLQPLRTFDTLHIWNDHQDSGEVELTNIPGKPSPLKKKFNVFRTQVPRDKEGLWSNKGLNRIRNTWAYIQLARNQENTDMLIFNDLDVDFFE